MKQNNSLSLRRGAAFLAVVALSGCAALEESAPVVDSQMGLATRAIWAAQTINPQAGKNTDPVNGMEGVSAVNNIQATQQSFGGLGSSNSSGSSGTGGSSSGSGSSSGTPR